VLISLAIFLVVAVTYRSLAAGLLLLVCANLANFAVGAIMRGLGISLDVSTLPIASVGMGVGIDYNVYLLSRMVDESTREPAGERLVADSIRTTGEAICFTALAMISATAPWYWLSSLKFQADMGLLLASVMCIHLVLALCFLPAVVYLFRPAFLAGGAAAQAGRHRARH
jgi:hypothetical protein